MKRILLFFIVLFSLQASAELPPILDRELFFGILKYQAHRSHPMVNSYLL